LKQIEIQEIELKEQSLSHIPKLEKQLQETIEQLRNQIEIIAPKDSIERFYKKYQELSINANLKTNTQFFSMSNSNNVKASFIDHIIYKSILNSIKENSNDNCFVKSYCDFCFVERKANVDKTITINELND